MSPIVRFTGLCNRGKSVNSKMESRVMSDRENILSALREKPLKVFEIMRRANVTNEESCQSLLLKMRDEGSVKFDIHKGRWFISSLGQPFFRGSKAQKKRPHRGGKLRPLIRTPERRQGRNRVSPHSHSQVQFWLTPRRHSFQIKVELALKQISGLNG